MSSRSHTDVARERRIKRFAARYGVTLMLPQRLNPQIRAHGGYMLRDTESFKVMFGNKGYDFSADLDEIEAWLDANTAKGSGDEE